MAYSKGSLVLTRATLDDLPTFPAVCFQPFHTEPYFKKMIPDTPANQEWWRKYYKSALLDPKTHMVKVTDQQNGKIVAFASWLLPRDDDGPQPGSGEDRWAEFTEDFDKSLADALFGSMAQARDKFMGDRKHYCRYFASTSQEGDGSLYQKNQDV